MEFINHNWLDKLFFRQPSHTKYSEKLIEYQIIELITNEDVLKVLIEFNYWKCFCLIEILAIFNKPIIQLLEEDMSALQHLSNKDYFCYFHVEIVIVSTLRYFRFIMFCLLCFNFILLFSIVI